METMIPRGKSLCATCGKITDEILFYDHNRRLALCYHPKDHAVTSESGAVSGPIALRSYDRESQIPKKITIRYSDAARNAPDITLNNRICPYCWHEKSQITYLSPWIGQHRCYVIGMAGASSAGKTHWMRSATYANSLTRYMKHTLRPMDDKAVNLSSVRMDPTQKNMLDIRDFEVLDGHGRVRCMLRMVDLSGEYFMQDSAATEEDLPYLHCCDAIHYILDGSLTEPIGNLAFAKDLIDSSVTTDRLRIAISFAKSDKLLRRVKRQDPSLFYEDGAGNRIPVLNESSLCFQQPPANETLQHFALRMSLNRHIICKLHHMLDLGILAEEDRKGDIGYFILSNGVEIDEKTFDYSKQRCVYDPLIWILYSLGLYRFPEEESK